jgi:hypothetical protein
MLPPGVMPPVDDEPKRQAKEHDAEKREAKFSTDEADQESNQECDDVGPECHHSSSSS